MFSEDSPHFASFNYRLKGFKDPPTDQFARPFWMAAADLGWEHFCINGRALHKVAFEYMLGYFRAYRNTPKFSFVSLAPLTHENINSLGYADDDFKILLQHLKEESFLDSTFLVVFGDHGPRFSALRQTIQGNLRNGFHFYQSQHQNGFQYSTQSFITTLCIIQVFLLHRLIYTLPFVTLSRIPSIQVG